MKMDTSKGSEAWNALPDDDKRRLNGILISHQIRDIEIERQRAIDAHRAHMEKINDHLRNVQKEYIRWEWEAINQNSRLCAPRRK